MAAGALVLATACSDVKYPESPTGPAVENLQYKVEGKSVTLSWTLPAGAIASEIIRNNTLVTTVPAAQTTYSVSRETAGSEISYTVKAVYEGDIVSAGQTVRFTIESVPAKVALLIPCDNVADLTDDDEIAAAEWFQTTYATNGDILTPADIPTLSPDDYAVVWINIDRVGLQPGWQNLPESLVSDEAVAALTKYAAEGGNLFLTKFATQLTVPYEIIEARYAPGIFGSGSGGSGSDNWCVNAQIGYMNHESNPSQFYDHRADAIYKGMTTLPDYGHETFALEGPGWREDHNCMWDLNSYGFDGNPNTVVNFEQATNSIVLGTWAHVVDYAVAGIVQFLPTANRAGQCIAIGLSAYEFAQNGGNPFQDNVNRLTENCISVLNQ